MREHDSAIHDTTIAVTPNERRPQARTTLLNQVRGIWSEIRLGQEALFHQPWNRDGGRN